MRSIIFSKIILISLFFTPHCHSMDELKKDIHHIKEDLEHAKHDIGLVLGVLSPELSKFINGTPAAITKNPHKDTVAHVRYGAEISDGEKAYLTQRMPIVKACLQKLLSRDLEDHQIPTIAFVMSGGGYRALLSTVGFLRGIEQTGLLDSATYITALSGSTWAVGPWISTDVSLEEFERYIVKCVKKPVTLTTDAEELLIFETAAVKSLCKQPKSPVDLYGDLLANRLLVKLGDTRHMTYLSDQAKIIENGKHPYPIYVAIDGNENIVAHPDWYEFTPHEVGKCNDTLHIPTWAYGRRFKAGTSVDSAPEKTLGYVMGTCGSAFGANIETIDEELAKTVGHLELLEKLTKSIAGNRPLGFEALIANYRYKMNTGKSEPEHQSFVDAGLDFNDPITPVVYPYRKADVLIICDASADHVGGELKKASEYMQQHNLPFPEINFDGIDKKTMSVLRDENNRETPAILYFPRISDHDAHKHYQAAHPQSTEYDCLKDFNFEHEVKDGWAKTIHFQYAPKNANRIIRQMEFNVRHNEAAIIKALTYEIDRRK